jgi:O-acetyl-ADP-ribose deacetylase (regulator of RNase III)/uncharacterized protein YwgA
MITVTIGDIFESRADALVNTVNTVGIMGKGIALGFKKRYPDMFEDYARRCERGEVRLGRPYIYKRLTLPHIINFPTKEHWRSVSKLSDIVRGLEFLAAHIRQWDVNSLAVPPLGCGEGQLEWRVVGPTLYRHLKELPIAVELYAPFGTPHEELEISFLALSQRPREEDRKSATAVEPPRPPAFRVEPGWVALVAILERIARERHHWPIGRIGFQKLAYFATEAGIPTGLIHERGSYGPYSSDVKRVLSALLNNGLIAERRLGNMFAATVGPTFTDAKRAYAAELGVWEAAIERVTDLFLRMRTNTAEIAATVHFVSKMLAEQERRRPTEKEVLAGVMHWKQRRRPPVDERDVALAIRHLNMLGWIDVQASKDLPINEELLIA